MERKNIIIFVVVCVIVIIIGLVIGLFSGSGGGGTIDTVLGAPTDLTAEAKSVSRIDLSWVAPVNTGGSAIKGYKIEQGIDGVNWPTFINTGTTAITRSITGLTQGIQYFFRVSAINDVGKGPVSNTANAITFDVPDKPTGLTAEAKSISQIDLSWVAPVNNGGSSITDYKIEQGIDGVNWPTFINTGSTDITYSVTGLTQGIQYFFRVSAINDVGKGPVSATVNATTFDVPGKPTGLTAEAKSISQIDLSWTAPTNTGGSAITGYKIEQGTDGVSWPTVINTVGEGTTRSVTGLTRGTRYYFKVSAVNAVGTGAASDIADATTNEDVPGSPTGLTALSIVYNQVVLSWTAPADDGGATIVGYKVERSLSELSGYADLDSNTETAITSYTDSTVNALTTYFYRVSAINSVGTGSVSNVLSVTTTSTINWVAVGYDTGNGNIMNGSNGITWSDSVGGTSFAGRGVGVAYGSSGDGTSMWVAVGSGSDNNGNIMYSYDGISWSESVGGNAFSTFGLDIAYGASGDGTPMWVAVGEDTGGTDNGHIKYSYDGISWSDSVGGTSFSNSGEGVAYGTSGTDTPMWVATGQDSDNSGRIKYSYDGISWSDSVGGTSFSSSGSGIAYGSSGDGTPMWVATGNDGTSNGNIMYSYDGISWCDSVGGISFSGYGQGVAYGTSGDGTPMWVAVGEDTGGTDNGHIKYSYDGISWSDSVGGTSFINSGQGVAYGTSGDGTPMWVAAGLDVGTSNGNIMYSYDGISWSDSVGGTSFSSEGRDVAYGMSLFGRVTRITEKAHPKVTGLTAETLNYSQIDLTWTAPPGVTVTNYRIERSKDNEDSYDSIKNTASTSFTDTGLDNSTTYYYRVRATTDEDFTGPYSDSANAKTDATPILNWVAVGNDNTGNGNIMYSGNGISWADSVGGTSFSTTGLGVAYGSSGDGTSMWVAVGSDSDNNGNIMYSYDGISWSDSVGGTLFDNYGNGIAYGSSGDGTPMWVAVGDDTGGTFDITILASTTTGGFMMSGSDRNRSFTSQLNPTVTINVRDTVNFLNNSTSTTHPFFIRDSDGGPNVSTPVAATQGATNGQTNSWRPNTAGDFVYQCGSHPAMKGILRVVAGDSGNIMYSYDGISWSDSVGGTSFSGYGIGIAYGTSRNGTSPMWVAVGDDSVGNGSIMYSYNGISWSDSVGGTSFSNRGYGVAYGTSGNGTPMWVATGNDSVGNGNIMYSYDGISWSDSVGGTSFSTFGYSVAYGTSGTGTPMWVATGNDSDNNGNIMYSYDGISWSDSVGGTSFSTYGYGIAYGTSGTETPMWVAVGYDGSGNGNIMYSYDGISWSDSVGGTSFSSLGYGITYGMSLFGRVTQITEKAYPKVTDLSAVVLGSNQIKLNWTAPPGVTVITTRVERSKTNESSYDEIGATGDASTTFINSGLTDGTYFYRVRAVTAEFTGPYSASDSVTISVLNWVAVGDDTGNGNILNSGNGIKWSDSVGGTSFNTDGRGVAYGTSRDGTQMWVAVGYDNAVANRCIIYCYDGISWSDSVGGDTFNTIGNGIAYGSSGDGTPMWVATGNDNINNGNIMYSYDGISWSDSVGGTSFSTEGFGVAYGTSRDGTQMWVAVGDDIGGTNNGNIMYSYDGISWSDSVGGTVFFTNGYGVAYGTSGDGTPMWVAVGNDGGGTNNGHIMYSYDGISWSDSVGGTSFSTSGFGIAYGSSGSGTPMWVAVGDDTGGTDNGNIMYSYDGISWSDSVGGTSFSDGGAGIAYGTSSNGTSPMWVAVGDDTGGTSNGNIMYSYDGISWSDSVGGTSFSDGGHGIAYGMSLFGRVTQIAEKAHPKVTDLSADALNHNQISLSWTAPPTVTVASYEIERSEGDEDSYDSIKNTASTSFTDTGLDSSTTYYYRVRATTDADFTGPYSASADATTDPTPILNWVAVGDDDGGNGSIVYSYDGISWSDSIGGNAFSIRGKGVAYGSSGDGTSMWVAMGQDSAASGRIMYSYDGISWSDSVGGATFSVMGWKVAYGLSVSDPRWVAVGVKFTGGKNGNIKYSHDGITWSDSDSGGVSFSLAANGIAYGMYSTTGAGGWLPRVEDVDAAGLTPRWAASGQGEFTDRGTPKFISLLASDDGIRWSSNEGSDFGTTATGWNIAYGNSKIGTPMWVAVGQQAPNEPNQYKNVQFSYDGKYWHYQGEVDYPYPKYGTSFSKSARGVAYGTSSDGTPMWVAVGDDGGGNENIKYSYDGISWSDSVGGNAFSGTGGDGGGLGIAYGTSGADTPMWVATGLDSDDNGNIMYSYDGISWSDSVEGNALSNYGNGIAYGMSLFGRVTQITGKAYPRVTNLSATFSGIGQVNLSWTAPPGVTVTTTRIERSKNNTNSYSEIGETEDDSATFTDSVLIGNTYFYKVRAVVSDLFTGPYSASTSVTIPAINWVAVGKDSDNNGNIKYSHDGISWNDSVGGTSFSNNGNEIAYGSSGDGTPMWVAVGNDTGGADNGHIMYSYDGISWSDSVGGTSFSTYGHRIAFGSSGNGTPMWVATGLDSDDNGNIMYSYDGISWSDSVGGTSFSTAGIGIAYGTSGADTPMWVAVGNGDGGNGSIMYSYDGISWSDSVGGTSFSTHGSGIAYGSSGADTPMWVATGNDGTSNGNIMYSYNGISWSDSVGGTSFSSSGDGIAYGSSGDRTPMWVAIGQDTVGADNGHIMYSYDGISWSDSIGGTSFSSWGHRIAFGSSGADTPMWVATGDGNAGGNNNGNIMYSYDGISWSDSVGGTSFSDYAKGIAYGMSLFGRVTQITEKAYPNVTDLTATLFGANQVKLDWTAPPGVTVTTTRIERREGDEISYIEIETTGNDSTTFTDSGLTVNTYFYRVRAVTSDDITGSYSESVSVTVSALWMAVGYDGGGNGNIMNSANGITWKDSVGGTSFSTLGSGVAYGTIGDGTSMWVAVGGDGAGNGSIMYSYDGLSWSDSVGGTSFSNSGRGVAYGSSGDGTPMWVATGEDSGNGNIMYSYNGISWSDSVGGTSFSTKGEDVSYGTISNGTSPMWVAVGDDDTGNGNIMYSYDGISWSDSVDGDSFSSEGKGVAYGTRRDGTPMWVATGVNTGGTSNGNIMYSYDGISWSDSVGGTSFSITGENVSYGTSGDGTPMWVAAGHDSTNNGHIKYSYDGISWSDSVGGTSFIADGTGVAYGTSGNETTPMWVAVGNNGVNNGDIKYSYDGISWSDSVGGTSFSNYGLGIAYGMSLFGRVTQIKEKAHPAITNLLAIVSGSDVNLSWTVDPGVTVYKYRFERTGTHGGVYWEIDTKDTFDITILASTTFNAFVMSGRDRNRSFTSKVDPTVTINVGDTVNFLNNSTGTVHPFYIRRWDEGPDVDTPAAATQGATNGQTNSWTPNTAGWFVYQCGSHPFPMKGILRVLDEDSRTFTDSGLIPGTYVYKVRAETFPGVTGPYSASTSAIIPDVNWVTVGDDGGGNGSIMHGYDGITWSDSVGGTSFGTHGRGIAYGTSGTDTPMWVAVGKDSGGGYGCIMYSYDGISWSDSVGGDVFRAMGVNIAYGSSGDGTPMWVAVGDDTEGTSNGNIMYSYDGISWSYSVGGTSFSDGGAGIAYGTSGTDTPMWVATGDDGGGYGCIMYSYDGISWSDSVGGTSFSTQGNGVAYGTSGDGTPMWVAVGFDDDGYDNGHIMYSYDGVSWSDSVRGNAFITQGTGVAYGSSGDGTPMWVAVGQDVGDGNKNIMYSYDGISWSDSVEGTSFNLNGNGIAYGTSGTDTPMWVAAGSDYTNNGNIMYSYDGISWSDSIGVNAFSDYGRGIAYGMSLFGRVTQITEKAYPKVTNLTAVVLGSNQIKLDWTAPPGVTVTTTRIERRLNGESSYIEIGETEDDSTTFTDSDLTSNTYFYRVRSVTTDDITGPYSASVDVTISVLKWVAVGDDTGNGNIMNSDNGITWSDSVGGTSFSTLGLYVAYGTSGDETPMWVAAGNDGDSNGNIMYSYNGISWSDSVGGTSFSTRGKGIAYGLSGDGTPMWVAAGSDDGGNGSIMYSYDGISWSDSVGGTSFSTHGNGIAYGSDGSDTPLWVAVGETVDDNGNIKYSYDGISWSDSVGGTLFLNRGEKVAYGSSGNGTPMWVATGNDGTSNGNIKYSYDGISWSDSVGGTSFSGSGRSIAYGTSGDGTPMWVATGADDTSNGNIMYSYNGISWSDSVGGTSFSTFGLGIAFGSSGAETPMWAAGGNGSGGNGHIRYSYDGISWSDSVGGTSFSGSGNGIAYGMSLFGRVTHIKEKAHPAITNLLAIFSGDNQVNLTWTAPSVGTATSYQIERRTSDESSYSLIGTPTAASYSDSGLANNTYFYRVRAVTSPGVTGPYSESGGVTISALKWVAVGFDSDDNGRIMNSANGITWSDSVGGTSFSTRGYGVAYGTSRDGTSMWVATGQDSDDNGNIMYSYDGISWSDSVGGNAFSSQGRGIAYGSSGDGTPMWVATGWDVDNNGNIMYSYDGISWSDSVGGTSFSNQGFGVAYGTIRDGTPMWVAIGWEDTGTSNGNIKYSYDGISWSDSVGGTSFSSNGNKVAYGSSGDGTPMWVASGTDGGGNGNIMYSYDGISWSDSVGGTSFSDKGHGIAYGTSGDGTPMWVAVGEDSDGTGHIMHSYDGISWSDSVGGTSFTIHGNKVAYGTSGETPMWLATGNDDDGNGNIMYSYDGISWSDSVGGTSFSNYGLGIAYGMSLFGRVNKITEKAHPKVTNLSATIFGSNQVDLTWTAPPGVTVTTTRIERSPNDETNYVEIYETEDNSTTFTDRGLANNTYFYKVRAVTSDGFTGPYSESGGVTISALKWVAVGNDTGNGNIMNSANGITWSDSVGGDVFSYGGYDIAYGTSGDGTSPMWVATGHGSTDNTHIKYSYDGISWSDSVGGNPFSVYGNGIAYGTSGDETPMWVAAGLDANDSGHIKYSYDGISWSDSIGVNAFSNNGYSVAYGSSGADTPMWVAAGDDGANSSGNIMYSYDGISWSDSVGGDAFSVSGLGVAYGTGGADTPMWVAVGKNTGDSHNNNGSIMYSYDGISWSDSVGGTSFNGQGNGVAYGTSGDGTPMWVAVGYDSTNNGNIMYSYDGISWSDSVGGTSFSSQGYGIAYGTSGADTPLWVATGDNSDGNGNIMYSYDGISWSDSVDGNSFSANGNGVAYGMSLFGRVTQITEKAYPNVTDLTATIFGANRVNLTWTAPSVGTATSYQIERRTADESSYSLIGTPTAASYSDSGLAGNTYFYRVRAVTSPGVTGPYSASVSLTISALNWVAVGVDTGNGNIMNSANGITWSDSVDGDSFSIDGYGVAYGTSGNGTSPMWVAAGSDSDNNGNIMYSYDGISWSDSIGVNAFSNIGNGIAYGTSGGETPMWVAVGVNAGGTDSGNIMYSYDGISWSDSVGGDSFANHGNGIAYGSSGDGTPMWVAVGHDGIIGNINKGHIKYSYDGISWSDSVGGNAFGNFGIYVAYGTSGNGIPMWVAVGYNGGNGNIMYSYDGISWSDSVGGDVFPDGLGSAGHGIAYGTSGDGTPMWVATGYDSSDDNGHIMYSYDGISWSDSVGGDAFDTGGYSVAYGTSGADTPMWVATGNDSDGNGNVKYSYDGISWSDSVGGTSFSDDAKGIAYGMSLFGRVTHINEKARPEVSDLLATIFGSNRVDLTWTAPSVGTATSYQIERRTADEISYSLIGTPTAASYSDSGLAGNTYFYRVRAVTSPGFTGPYSASVDVTISVLKWVAVGEDTGNGNIMNSVNGITWSDSVGGDTFSVEGWYIAYGTSSNGTSPMWMAVGIASANNGNIMYSYDGISWSDSVRGNVFSNNGRGVAYGTSGADTPMWVAVGQDSANGRIMYSYDGISWSDSVGGTSFSTYGFGIAYGSSGDGTPMWVAVGYDTGGANNGNIMYSYDGISWSDSVEGDSFGGWGNCVAYGTNGDGTPMWVAVGYDIGNGNIMYSYDGISWSDSVGGNSFSGGAFEAGSGVAYGTSGDGTPMWVASGYGDAGGNGSIMYSYDGISWSDSVGGTSFSISGYRIAYGTSGADTPMWVATGDDGGGYGCIMYSYDGISWSDSVGGDTFSTQGNGVAYGMSLFGRVTQITEKAYPNVTDLTATIFGSNRVDLTWTAPSVGTATSYKIERRTADESSYSLIGTPTAASYSDSGLAGNTYFYKVRAVTSDGFTGPYSESGGVTISALKWVAVGVDSDDNGRIMNSANGITWSDSVGGTSFSTRGYGVAYGTSGDGTSMWVATGQDSDDNGNIMYSYDGISWSDSVGGTSFSNSGAGVAYGTSGNGTPMWVAVGNDDGGGNGSIMYSYDGISWSDSVGGTSFITTGVGIAYGTSSNGTSTMWVAVGVGSDVNEHIKYSYDGISWSDSVGGTSFSNDGLAIAYGTRGDGAPMWVATGNDTDGTDNGHIKYSYDGISWSDSVGGNSFSTAGHGIAYGTSRDGTPMWVATGNDSTGTSNGSIMYSYDGISWSDSVGGTSFSSVGVGIGYGTSGDETPMWVAVGEDTGGTSNGNIMYSYDGISWSDSVGGTSFSNSGSGVAVYGMSLFGRVTQIKEKAHPEVSDLTATIFGANQVNLTWTAPSVGTATSYQIERRTSDESSYSLIGTPTAASYSDRGLANNTYFYRVRAVTSPGVTGPYSESGGVTISALKWVAVGFDSDDNGRIMNSANGITWSDSVGGTSFSTRGYGVAYGTSRDGTSMWVATGQDSDDNGNIMYSYDGISWSDSVGGNAFSSQGRGIAYGSSGDGTPMWVATGWDVDNNENIMYSYDGISWSDSVGGTSFSNQGFGVAYGTIRDGTPMWVAIGWEDTGTSNGNIKYSYDGISWSDSVGGTSFSSNGNKVAYGSSGDGTPMWVASGTDGGGNGNIMYSYDGISWSDSVGGTSFSDKGHGIAYGTSGDGTPMWVAVGEDSDGTGHIMHSYDGISWSDSVGGTSFTIHGNKVAYGTSGETPMWLATGNDDDGNGNIMYSYDGISWSDSVGGTSFSNYGLGIAYGMSLFGRVNKITEKAHPKVTNLSATIFGSNQVDLTWTAPPGVTVTTTRIERSPNDETNYVEIYETEDNSTTFTDRGLANNTYFYKVRAVTSDGFTGPYSESGGVTISALKWVAVGNDTGNGNIMNSANGITWSDSVGGDVFSYGGYDIAYGTSGDGTSPMWVATGHGSTDNTHIKYSYDGISWSDSVGGNPFSVYGNGIAYGTSGDETPMWVAAGLDANDSGHIKYSYDGISWSDSIGVNAFSNNGYSVAYGSSGADTPMWVAAGDDGANSSGNIMYSYDGISWSDSVGGDAFSVSGLGVAYGTGGADTPMWVAVGKNTGDSHNNNGSIMYSYDGISWSDSVGGTSFNGQGNGVAYGTSGDGTPMWVAVGYDSTNNGNIMYSYDGISWSDSVGGTSFSSQGYGIAYGTSGADTPLWVATGDNSDGNGNIMYSYDGISWSDSVDGNSFSANGNGVAYGMSLFGRVTQITEKAYPNVTDLTATIFGANRVNLTWTAPSVGTATSYQIERRTADESSYSLIGTPTAASYSDSGLAGNTYFYRVRAVTSPGVTGPYSAPVDVTISVINWVAVGRDDINNNGNIMNSENGITWSDSVGGTSFSSRGYSVAYGTSQDGTSMWVAVGSDGANNIGHIMYSYDGISWSDSVGGTSFSTRGYSVAYGTSGDGTPMWVATGWDTNDSGNIIYSYDGISWSDSVGGTSFSTLGRGIAYGTSSNGTSPMWVVVGKDSTNANGHIMYSYDGISWSDSVGGNSFADEGYSVAYGTSGDGTPMWVSVGDNIGDTSNGSIKYSYDGISWSDSVGGTTFNLRGQGIAYGTSSNGTSPMWVATGHDGTNANGNIMYSYDGISWSDSVGGTSFSDDGVGIGYGTSGADTPMWVAVGNDNAGTNNGHIKYSYDGISWSDSVGGTSFSNYGLGIAVYGMSLFGRVNKIKATL